MKVLEPEDFVICRVCDKQYTQITGQHLKNHGLTMGEYLEKFPGAPILAEGIRKKLRDNNPMKNPSVAKRSGDSRKGISNTKSGEGIRRYHGTKEYEFICQNCGKKFTKDISKKKWDSGWRPKFCSRKCAWFRPHPWQEGDKNVMHRLEVKAQFQGDNNWMAKSENHDRVLALVDENREKNRQGQLKRFEDPKERERFSGIATKLWQDPEYRKAVAEGQAIAQKKVSIPEQVLHQILDELEITWSKNILDSLSTVDCYHIFDAVIEEYKGVEMEIPLEADGCYWHACKEHCSDAVRYPDIWKSVLQDTKVNSLCRMCKVPLYRFWEHDLLNNREFVKQQIQDIVEAKVVEAIQAS